MREVQFFKMISSANFHVSAVSLVEDSNLDDPCDESKLG